MNEITKPIYTKCVLFDIDGTVANIEHRRVYVQSKPKNWKAFNNSMHLDTRYDDMYEMYWIMHRKYPIVFASGRGEENRDVTEHWLDEHGFLFYKKLYMRAEKDYRPDNEVKFDILQQMRADGYEPVFVFDDRDQVVNMWRENGIRCFQVAPGNF